jgi:hypothetical protein
MKVWGKEVKYCGGCNYYTGYEKCALLGEPVKYPFEEIHIDCPFDTIITRKVIESFGFKFIIKDQYYISALGDKGITLLIDNDLYIQIIIDEHYLFQGTINNPEELRFILTSLGIIK